MEKLLTRTLVTFLAFFYLAEIFSQQPAAQQDTSVWVVVRTKGKKAFYGKRLYEDSAYLVLQTRQFDSLSVPKNTIRSMRQMRALFDNVHAPRYFAATSGHGLRKGEGSYDNNMLFLNQVSYGLSDRFTFGAGFSAAVLLDGPLAFWMTPKYSIPLKKDKIALVVGGIHGQVLGGYEVDNYTFSATYSQVTVGSRDANITFGAGLLASNGKWRTPIFSWAGTIRAAQRVALLLEGYTFEDYGSRITLTGAGLRFMGRRVALDAGAVLAVEAGYGAFLVPWGSLHIVFGRPKI
jgi:hypothetical protein